MQCNTPNYTRNNEITFDTYDPQNETQKVAKDFLQNLANYLISNEVPDAVIIWIQSAPWLWKSHLFKSFKTHLENNQVTLTHNLNDPHFLMMEWYKKSKIILIDDLFQDLQSLDNVKWPIIDRLSKLIFDIYENKKLLLITSNFDIKLILDKISAADTVWRLKDRITELLSHTKPIKLEWESYRIKKAETAKAQSIISEIYMKVGWTLPPQS